MSSGVQGSSGELKVSSSLTGREDILFEPILDLELGDDHNTDNGGDDDILG